MADKETDDTPQDENQDRGEREIVVTLRLPRELHAQLQALGGPRGLTREIRERLERSLKGELPRVPDYATEQLLRYIADIAHVLDASYRSWDTDTFALAVFKSAIDALLTGVGPKGEPKLKLDTRQRLFDPSDQPETVGRALAMQKLASWEEY